MKKLKASKLQPKELISLLDIFIEIDEINDQLITEHMEKAKLLTRLVAMQDSEQAAFKSFLDQRGLRSEFDLYWENVVSEVPNANLH